MKFADSQIDTLLKRHGRRALSNTSAEHLDADELNAFAEGAAPAAASARYVAHLADCDDCRKLASQLAISAGAVARARVAGGSVPIVRESFLQKLSSFFAPATLRYAAFAAVVIAAVGVTFIVLREQRRSSFSAATTPLAERPATASKQESPSAAEHNAQAAPTPRTPESQADKNVSGDNKRGQPETFGGLAPLKPGKDEVATASKPVTTEKKALEPATVAVEQQPSFAPPPPAEANRALNRDREETERVTKTEQSSDRLKMVDRATGSELSKDQRRGGPYRSANTQQATNQSNEARNEPRSVSGIAQAAKETDDTKRKSSELRADSDKAPETRSVHGHKFHREGSVWIDAKFKAGMAIINISRGSDEFRALKSDLRAIADDISGEVIIVKSGKAYRIK